jgi:hypothetical protein
MLRQELEELKRENISRQNAWNDKVVLLPTLQAFASFRLVFYVFSR